MRTTLLATVSFAVTILCWGVYGPVLHIGRHGMAVDEGTALLRPFVCVGLAYFAIGVLVPLVLLRWKGEHGSWSIGGAIWSLAAGVAGALGALGILLAFYFGGRPLYVMPLVFGGAPVVNAFITIFLARKLKEIGSVFLAGLIIVTLGAVTVLLFRPAPPSSEQAVPLTAMQWLLQITFIAMTILCWGLYGPVLHKGQAAMQNSRLRPLLCVGLAYFLIAVLVPYALLMGPLTESSEYTLGGSFWSLAAGAAGAVGALGIILAFNFGAKPVYVMPLVFGGAPIVNTFFSLIRNQSYTQADSPFFWAGLILAIAGSTIVLLFAPRGQPPKPAAKTPPQEKPASRSDAAPKTTPAESTAATK